MFQSQKLDTSRHQKNKIFVHFPTKKKNGEKMVASNTVTSNQENGVFKNLMNYRGQREC